MGFNNNYLHRLIYRLVALLWLRVRHSFYKRPKEAKIEFGRVVITYVYIMENSSFTSLEEIVRMTADRTGPCLSS